MEEASEIKKKRQKYEHEQRQQQKEMMPGERERIEYGLENLNAKEVIKALKEKVKSVEGLKAVAAVFSNDVMPLPQMKHCVRCNKDYDDQFPEQCVCRIMHPEHCTSEMWDGSKKSWEECERCGKSFNCSGFHHWDRRAVEDEGVWCFEGGHTNDEALVDSEDWRGTSP